MPDKLDPKKLEHLSPEREPATGSENEEDAAAGSDTRAMPPYSDALSHEEIVAATTTVMPPSEYDIAKEASLKRTGPVLQPDTVAIHLPGKEEPVIFEANDTIMLGREGSLDLSEVGVTLDGAPAAVLGVSRQHAVIRKEQNGYFIRDLNSTNGTWLNGKKLVADQPEKLRSGDQVRLGQLLLFVYFSFSTDKAIASILLEDTSRSHTETLREGLTADFLEDSISPFLRSLAHVQRILDELRNKPFQVNIPRISMHKNGRWVEVKIRGITEALAVYHARIGPLRHKTGQGDSGFKLTTQRPANESAPSTGSAQSKEKSGPTAEPDFGELTREVLTAYAPALFGNTEKLETYMHQLQPHLAYIAKSDLEIIL